MASFNSVSQKEYLKKYISGEVKKKKKKKITTANIKRSVIVDDDIDLKSMRPLEDDEVELYQMDEDAPQIAGIVDERPPEVKAQEYYSSKRWKVFGGEDGVNVLDAMNKDKNVSEHTIEKHSNRIPTNADSYPLKKDKHEKDIKNIPSHNDSDESPPRIGKVKSKNCYNDSDLTPTRKHQKTSKSDSDASPPRRKYDKKKCDLGESPPRQKYNNKNSKSFSDASPPRQKYDTDSDESPPRRDFNNSLKQSSRREEKGKGKGRERCHSNSPLKIDKNSYKQDRSDSDASPPRKRDKYKNHARDFVPSRKEKRYKEGKSDSDASPPRRTGRYSDKRSFTKGKRCSSDSDPSPPRRERKKSPKPSDTRTHSKSRSPHGRRSVRDSGNSLRDKSPNFSRFSGKQKKDNRYKDDSDDSPKRLRKNSEGCDSDLSPPRKGSPVNDRPMKKKLYKPNDDSSSDERSMSKRNKMKKTLDGKQAGLQDARQLKKELSDLKMKEESMFSKMDASVSGVGAAPVRRDRKTGQIRDLEKEKEAQREKAAKESVVNEKYYKWGKGIKQTEDAAIRAAEVMKEMNKPLARYVDDKDLDDLLKAQEREGDPMLEYIKRKQSESTPLQGEKPIYKGSWNPNRFNIRPGYRWDGVVRSNGYEQEWFKTKNAKKARDEEAYKWSTSDM